MENECMDDFLLRAIELRDIARLSADSMDHETDETFHPPYFRQHAKADPLFLQHHPKFQGEASGKRFLQEEVIERISRLDPLTVARIDVELRPEELLRHLTTLPDMQQLPELDSEIPHIIPDWKLPPLDFEVVLDRDPFSKTCGTWKEVDTSGFEIGSKTSAEMTREPNANATDDNVLGSNSQMPFVPGGMEDIFHTSDRLAALTPQELEEGQEWVRNIKQLPVLPEKFRNSTSSNFLLDDDDEPSLISTGKDVNNLSDIFDERETTLVKKLLSVGKSQPNHVETQATFRKEMLDLLTAAGYGELYSELNPGEYFDGVGSKEHVISTTGSLDTGVLEKREWAVKVDLSQPITDFRKRVPNMAHKYPFELDTFQKQAVIHLENHESVFVAAHTSAGKTVVAEYAISLCLRAKSRCVYTSPIKALSNQKYRDFKKTFGDVGLLTGDVQIEPNAHCLVMTTEILRSMLYRGSELVRDLDWVIFDEVHYINDSERGVVWEEILIMLPAQVGIVMLSATVPNAVEFANWIGRIKQRTIYVMATTKRPVPLEHHLFVCVGSKTIDKDLVIVDTKGAMQTKGYAEAVEIQKNYEKKANFKLSNSARIPPEQDRTIWLAFMAHLRKNDLLPLIAFVFSRNRCDELGEMLASLDLTSQKEKHAISIFFRRAVSRLSEVDRELPQIRKLEYLLERGIGVHHSGVLPILKEAVEMLFQEGLVKVLFATETFAMGVNMPARCVAFDAIRKHDGTEFRDLLPGEYIQMSGRAGRRGLDKTGTVYILCKMARIPEVNRLNQMILGVPTKLVSQFRLTYGMILQLLRIGTISMMDMMKRSFSEHKTRLDVPKHQKELKQLKASLPEATETDCPICSVDLDDYCRASQSCMQQRESLNSLIFSLDNQKICAPGRVLARTSGTAGGSSEKLAVVLGNPPAQPQQERLYTVLQFKDLTADHYKAEVVSVPVSRLGHVLNAVIKVEGAKIVAEAERAKTNARAKELFGETVNRIGEMLRNQKKLQPLRAGDIRVDDFDIAERWESLSVMEASLASFQCTKCPQFDDHIRVHQERMSKLSDIRRLEHLLSNESLQLLPEYHLRLQVLKELQYVTAADTITLRGRVACEISTTELDLLISECLFENVFDQAEPAEIAAALSGVVFQGKTEVDQNLPVALRDVVERMRAVALKIGYCQRECGMKEAPTQMADQLNFGLAEVVYRWCKGLSFVEIASMTDVQEGIIVRTMTRLDEVCRDVKAGAKVTGLTRLISKMEAAEKALKRDIAFIGSLYITD